MWQHWPEVSLKEVIDESQGSKYFIFLHRRNGNSTNLKFSLLNGNEAYQTEITLEDIKVLSQKSRISLSEFTQLTISALTCDALTECSFAYTVLKTQGALELTWKKVVPEDSIKIKLASLKFTAVDNGSETCDSLQQLSLHILEKSQQLKAFRDRQRELEENVEQLKRALETDIVALDKLEREMYGRFVLVLNKKKDKCREYRQEVEKLKGRQVSAPVTRTLSDTEEPVPTKKSRDNSLLFEDSSSDDCQPTQTQRIVKNNKKKTVVPQSQPPSRRSGNKSKPPAPSNSSLADTQDLMDIL